MLGDDHQVSTYTVEVLRAAQRAGVKLVVATGREVFATRPVIAGLDMFDMAVCSNGAAVVDLSTNEVIERSEFAGFDAAVIVEQVREHIQGTSFAWSSTIGFGCEDRFVRHAPFLIETVSGVAPTITFDQSMSFSKVFVAHPTVAFDDLAQQVRAVISINAEVASGGAPFVAITAPNVTKANALAKLCANWSIDAARVVAFGDSWNDVEMLRWAGLGVAMANAQEPIKKEANDIAGTNNDDGVAVYLATLLG